MNDAILAIDFGTSTSSAAVVADDEVQQIREPWSGSPSWPSAVYLDGDTLLVGTPAERHKRVSPLNYRAQFKRDLDRQPGIVLGDPESARSFTPQELVAEMLRALRAEAEQRHGRGRITRAVLTVPTSYGPQSARRRLMIEAGVAAGFEAVELIYEPVAAAMHRPAGEPFAPGSLFLVYDFGGGTFDAALVRGTGPGQIHDVLGRRTLDECGGADIDASVVRWLRENAGAELAAKLDGRQPDGSSDPLAAHRANVQLDTVATALKHQLSDRPRAVELFDQMLELSLDLGTFTKLAEPTVDRTVRCCTELLDAADVPAGRLAGILLVGGSSRMPMVATALEEAFRCPVRRASDPENAVLLGAAQFARLAGQRFTVQIPDEPAEQALRWTVPGDTAELLRWRVGLGEAYPAGAELAEARLESGAIFSLRSRESGTVRALHAEPGAQFVSGDWLLTADRTFRPWRTGLHTVFGPPAVLGGTVFACCRNGRLDARAVPTGAPRWRRELGVEIAVAPTAVDGCVYIGAKDGQFHAFDAATGQPRWRHPYQTGDAISTAADCAGSLVCFTANEYVHVLDAATGERRHLVHVRQRVSTTAAFGSNLYVACVDGMLLSVDLWSGQVGWQAQEKTLGAPLVAGGAVLACFDDGTLRLLGSDDGGQRWSAPYEVKANRPRAARYVPYPRPDPPALAHDVSPAHASTVCLGTGDGAVIAFDLGTGAERWRRQVVRSPIRGLSAHGGVIYAASADRVFAMAATEQSPIASFGTGGKLRGNPVVDGGVVYVSVDGFLYALEAKTLQGPGPGSGA
ncbi:MAG TPA: hsp70 family protein [Actinocrinis sp.]|uniref:hsp70 family protein n=1 Tax=Actinocrinis sp. TaxID=1920516 RepID=UPI002DDD6127|nr:hsp70 family protein [Actinocrinis sp.]HEV2343855.1 hsp70 family protein [Actinocrinis sp.]